MTSRVYASFWRDYARLPDPIKARAQQAYKRFSADPSHPSLQFKPLKASEALWSVRVAGSYRAVGVRKNDSEIVWFFIGTHADYDRLLASL